MTEEINQYQPTLTNHPTLKISGEKKAYLQELFRAF